MPLRPPRPCAKAGCGRLTAAGRFCALHESDGAYYDRQRGSPSSRGYGRDWQKLRRWFLSQPANVLCLTCKAEGRIVMATEVDHIVSVKDAPARRLDVSNLRPLCKPCHSRRTATEQRGARDD